MGLSTNFCCSGLDETLLLLGTPPKKKRQSMSVSFLKNTPDRRLTLDKRIGPVRVEPGEVDLILACSPGEVKVITQESRAHIHPPFLKVALQILGQKY